MDQNNSKTFQIGSLKLENRFILAPLTKVTDLPFRLLVKKYHPGLMYTEMIDAKNVAKGRTSVLNKLKTTPEEVPVGLQLFGTQENYYTQAIKRVENNFACFDLNLGCPTDEAVSQGAGVILLRRPQKMIKIIEAMVNATSKPITVKIRLGLNDSSNFIKTIHQIEQAGASAIVIHGRLAHDPYKIPANWNFIKQAKEELKIPVIGNGDIFNGKTANHYLNENFADAIMIGRAAMHNPRIFEECIKETELVIEEEVRWQWIEDFYRLAIENDFLRLIRLRKRISDFLHPFLSIDQRKYLRNESNRLSMEDISKFLLNTFNKRFPNTN